MKKILCIFFIIINVHFISAQQDRSALSREQQEIEAEISRIKQEPVLPAQQKNEEITLSRLLKRSKKLNYEYGIFGAGSALMNLYHQQSRNEDVIKLGDSLIKIPVQNKDSYGNVANIYRMYGSALSYLGLYDNSRRAYGNAIKYAEQVEDKDTRHYLLGITYSNMTSLFHYRQFDNKELRDSIPFYHNKSLSESNLIRDNNPSITKDLKYDNVAFSHMRLGIHYLEQADVPGSIAQAEEHLMIALGIYQDSRLNHITDNQIMILNQVSWLFMEKKEYQKSIDYAFRALELEKQFSDPYHRVESFEFLGTSYTELGDKAKSKYYMGKYTALKDSIRIAEVNSTNKVMKDLVTNAKEDYQSKSKKYWVIAWVLLLAGIAVTYFLWRRRERQLRSNYDRVIARMKAENHGTIVQSSDLESVQDSEYVTAMSADSEDNKNIIPEETEARILRKLDSFERSERFLRKDISIGLLAGQLGTNSKYLSEVINTKKSQNFSNYINGLRINYIVQELYNNPRYREYKISYLADTCGFSSPQVFVLAFKRVNGVTPSYFINSLKNEFVNLDNGDN